MERRLRAEQRALTNRRSAEQRLEREVRRKEKAQASLERKQARRAKAASREFASRRRPPRNSFEAWLDEHDAPVEPLTRADLHSQNDDIAASVVAEGGGIQEVIDATDLRTLENVTSLIDPAILKQALDNDVLRRTQASNPPPP
jgi:hypothetical protein